MSNFNFLKSDFKILYDACYEAEKSFNISFRGTAIQTRRALEIGVKLIYKLEKKNMCDSKLVSLIKSPKFRSLFNAEDLRLFEIIRVVGNNAAHSDKIISENDTKKCLQGIYGLASRIGYWYGSFEDDKEFDFNLIPIYSSAEKEKELKIENKKIEEALIFENLRIEEKEKRIQELEAKLVDTLSQIDEDKNIKDEKKQETKTKHRKLKTGLTEAETREFYIDVMLRESGWNIENRNSISLEYPVVGMPNNSKGGFVDYVLWGTDGKPLAVIEVKKTSKSAKEGKHQAKLYVDCLEKMTGQRPIIFYTNGYDIYILDDANGYPARKIYGFYKKSELEVLVWRRKSYADIKTANGKIDSNITNRAYQGAAIRNVLETYDNKHRKALLIMATGTGKTRVAISLVKVLLESNWIKRVLFLADRTALVKQAKNNFTKFLPDVTTANLVGVSENENASVQFSTYQTMINEIDKLNSNGTRKYGVGYYDLIIIDESHRSLYNKYGLIFNYFDANLLGLTATPKDDIDKNTYSVFGLPNNAPTYAYNLDQAVSAGHLVPPNAREIDLKYPTEGVPYDELSDSDKEKLELAFEDGEDEKEKIIEGNAIYNWLFSKGTAREVLIHLMKNGHKVEGGDKLGKTIIFAKNDKHADFIVEQFNELYPKYGDDFCVKITNTVNYAQDLIDKFSTKKSMPQIVVSVDMLDTGIDVPEILNLVFFKKVKSKSKFWQMIGRGTRTCQDLYGFKEDKKDFKIFDFCQNISFFKSQLEEKPDKIVLSLSQQLFNTKIELMLHLQNYKFQENEQTRNYYTELLDKLEKDIQSIDKQSAEGSMCKEYLDKYSNRQILCNLDEVKLIEMRQNLSGVSYETIKEHELIKRFDLLMLKYQLNNITAKKSKLIEGKCYKLSNTFLNKASIPEIAIKLTDIKLLGDIEYLNSAPVLELERLRKGLRNLFPLLEKGENIYVVVDFEKEQIIRVEQHDLLNLSKWSYLTYNERLRKYLDEHSDLISLKKLRNAIPIEEEDVIELENLIFNKEIGDRQELEENNKLTIEKLKDNYGNSYLLVFVRTLIGLNSQKIREKFAEFMNLKALNPQQIDVIEMIINSYEANGQFELQEFIENQEFQRVSNEGIWGIFTNEQIQGIARTVNTINDTMRV